MCGFICSYTQEPPPPKLAKSDNRKRVAFHCSLADIESAQLDLGHKKDFVTKDPGLYVEREQQLLSLSPETSSIFEDEEEKQEKENSLRGG